MASLSSLTKASSTLTMTGVALNNETVTIGAKVYTFKTTLTPAAGEVLIGANQQASMDNLTAAINLAAGGDTTYGAATTRNPYVSAVAGTNALTVTALLGGVEGNEIRTAEALTNGSWTGTLLAGGAGSSSLAIQELLAGAQLNSEVLQAFDILK